MPELPDLLGVLMVLAGLIVIVVMLRRMPRLRSKISERRKTPADESAQAGLKATMEELAVQLHEMSRALNARLDTKMRVLDALLAKADEAVARLERLLAEKSEASASQSESRFADVYRLADEGKGYPEIARLKNLQPGEVELILNLRQKKERG